MQGSIRETKLELALESNWDLLNGYTHVATDVISKLSASEIPAYFASTCERIDKMSFISI